MILYRSKTIPRNNKYYENLEEHYEIELHVGWPWYTLSKLVYVKGQATWTENPWWFGFNFNHPFQLGHSMDYYDGEWHVCSIGPIKYGWFR